MSGSNGYGNALFLLAKEEGAIEEVASDLTAASAIFKGNPDYAKLLDTPAIKKEERLALIDEAFSSLHYSVVNLLKILCESHLVYTFKGVASAYSLLYDEYNGIERVEAVTAIPMTQKQVAAMEEKLMRITGKKIILKNTVEPKILGGVMLRYSGTQLDVSVKSRLDAFSDSLKNTTL